MTAVERLTRRPEFLRVAGANRKWVAPGLILQARRRNEDMATGSHGATAEAARLGITVSRKVGNAVQRNRARRRLRAIAREVISEEGRPGFDYVVIGRKATLTRPYAALVEDLRTAMRKLNDPRRNGARHGFGGRRAAGKAL